MRLERSGHRRACHLAAAPPHVIDGDEVEGAASLGGEAYTEDVGEEEEDQHKEKGPYP